MNLEEIREKIDELDEEMRNLFEKRMDCVKKVVEYKYNHQEDIFDPERELKVIEKNTKKLKNSEYEDAYRYFLSELMNGSKEYQKAWLKEKQARG